MICNKFYRKSKYSFLLYYNDFFNKKSEYIEETSKNIGLLLKTYDLIPNILFTSNNNNIVCSSNIIYNQLKLNNVPINRSFYFDHIFYYKNINNDINYKYSIKNINNLLTNNSITIDYEYNKKINKNTYIFDKNRIYKKSANLFYPFYNNNILTSLNENKFPLIITDKFFVLFFMKNILNINYSDLYESTLLNENLILINLYDNFLYKEIYSL
jgi:hypothetical protein